LKFKVNINRYLGDSFFEDLKKSEVGPILKEDANVAVFPHEMYVALQIVPRTVISLLVQHLKPLKPKDHIVIPWFLDNGTMHHINIDKISSDLYSGNITGEGRVLAKFQYRSLPAVGLVIMSTYELYDKETNKQDLVNEDINYDKVQKLIDEKIRLQITIEEVVNRKLSEKEAMQRMIGEKINDYLRTAAQFKQIDLSNNNDNQDIAQEDKSELETTTDENDEENNEEDNDQDSSEGDLSVKDIDVDPNLLEESKKSKKKSKLKEFLDKKKVKKNEKSVNINKNKDLHCPDCKTKLYKSGDDHIKCCICFGQFFDKEIKFTKSENGVKLKFPAKFEIDNIEMLLSSLKKGNK